MASMVYAASSQQKLTLPMQELKYAGEVNMAPFRLLDKVAVSTASTVVPGHWNQDYLQHLSQAVLKAQSDLISEFQTR